MLKNGYVLEEDNVSPENLVSHVGAGDINITITPSLKKKLS